MPAFYAHHRFGEAVLRVLESEVAKASAAAGSAPAMDAAAFKAASAAVENPAAPAAALTAVIKVHRPQFDIGLQGPDLFFFHRPYTKSRVAAYGHHLHNVSAMDFFQHALSVIETKGVCGGEYAYLLGFICHYILDSECHGYIADYITENGVEHLEIEEEFEKFLLRRAGKDPLAFPLGDLVPQDAETALAIAPFYENISPAVVKRSLADLRKVKRLLTAPGAVKQGAINGAFRLSGHYRQLKGLMHQRKDNPACAVSNEELLRLFEEAVSLAAAMMKSYDESLRTGSRLSERFDRNFL